MPRMDVTGRRRLLETRANTRGGLDYVVELEAAMATSRGGPTASVALRYVPDRLILEAASFARYLEAMAALDIPTLEELSVTIIDDVNNEVVVRWVQVVVSTTSPAAAGIEGHSILVEDRQPKWDNKALLSRLRRF